MHIFWAAFIASILVHGVSSHAGSRYWNDEFRRLVRPGKRDYDAYDYYVVEHENVPVFRESEYKEPMPIPNHWIVATKKGIALNTKGMSRRGLVRASYAPVRKLQKRPLVNDLEIPRSTKRQRAPIFSPNLTALRNEFGIEDPLFGEQWHIVNFDLPGHDMNILDVWRKNITGRGVTVAIVDDGIDYEHPDFLESFSKEGSWDFNLHQNMPAPLLADDHHGTRCAGEVAAGFNDVCGVGVAPGSHVAGIRILSGELTEADEALALNHRMDINNIYSCSWGPSDNGMTVEKPPSIVARALLNGVETGRDGKGAIYVFASGNGYSNTDNCNYDGYTNSIYSITISAVDQNNRHPYYSESCSANMVTTYSSNYEKRIVTCDRTDPKETIPQCTNQHSGTSAAAPIAAGIFALVLEQRPDLTWRDLQYLVRDTAKSFGIEEQEDWIPVADGKVYHNHYGFGLLDADAIVTRAKTWDLVGPQAWLFGNKQAVNNTFDENGLEVTYTVEQSAWDDANMGRLEHVNVIVDAEHEYRGSMRFSLRNPSGVEVELAAPRLRDRTDEPLSDWQFMSVAHWGDRGVGNWTLKVSGARGSQGKLNYWKLKLWGEARDASKAYPFSEDWDKYEHPELNPPNDVDPISSIKSLSLARTTPAVETSTTSIAEMSESLTSLATLPKTTLHTTSTPGHSHDDHYPWDEIPPAHTILFYILATICGIIVLVLLVGPCVYYILKRWNRSGYVTEDDVDDFVLDDVEINNFDDDYGIDPETSGHESPMVHMRSLSNENGIETFEEVINEADMANSRAYSRQEDHDATQRLLQ